jgi:hypothetical protein
LAFISSIFSRLNNKQIRLMTGKAKISVVNKKLLMRGLFRPGLSAQGGY